MASSRLVSAAFAAGIHDPTAADHVPLSPGSTAMGDQVTAGLLLAAEHGPTELQPRACSHGPIGQPLAQGTEIEHGTEGLIGHPLPFGIARAHQLPTPPRGSLHRLRQPEALNGTPGKGSATEGCLAQICQAIHQHHIQTGAGELRCQETTGGASPHHQHLAGARGQGQTATGSRLGVGKAAPKRSMIRAAI